MILLCIVLSAYIVLIAAFIYGFQKISGEQRLTSASVTRFTIVIPFRNEADNLPGLLQCLAGLEYPKELYEVILVDDESEDGYCIGQMAANLRLIANVRRSQSPKKDAIRAAIEIAKYEWIVTTDADCRMDSRWLDELNNFIAGNRVEMVAGPVRYHTEKGFLNSFQQLEMMSLQGTTAGSFGIRRPFMCNGANFAYTKDLFLKLNGFDGNETKAGGDDVFLLQKAASLYPYLVGYNLAAGFIVDTHAENTWRGLYSQRVRWASKAGSYGGSFATMTALIVLLANVSTLAAICLLFADPSPGLLLVLGLRWCADYVLIHRTATFMQRKVAGFLPSALLYPLFSTSVAVCAMVGRFDWKGRSYR